MDRSLPGRMRGRWLLPLLLAVLLGPLDARAQRGSRRDAPPPDPAQVARDLFAAGDFAGALDEFRRVLAETGDEGLRIDVARCLSRLDRPLEAVDEYETYLATVGPALPEAERLAAETERDAELARLALIDVTTDIDGVEVRLDGVPVGWTPLPEVLPVLPGAHVVELFHARYEDERLDVVADPGEVETVQVTMRVPPPPPPPPPPEESPRALRRAAEEEAAREAWNGGWWNPVPRALPFGWASSVPAGFMISAGAGVGDLTDSDAFEDSSREGRTTRSMNLGLTLPAFVGYRLHVAPMFAVGGYFLYQFHEVYASSTDQLANGSGYSLQGGAKLRVYVPLGLLEPFVGSGAAYAWARQDFDSDRGDYHQKHTLQGLVVPLEFGLDVVPIDFVTAGVWFQYAFGFWREYCHEYTRYPEAGVCPGPGETDWPAELPGAWSFAAHVTFYVR